MKGRDFDKSLLSRSADGIVIRPLYAKAEGQGSRPLRRSSEPWRVFQRVDHPEPHVAASFVAQDINGVADGLVLCFAGSAAARGFGIAPQDIDTIMEPIDLNRVPLRLDPAPHQGVVSSLSVVAAIQQRDLEPQQTSIDFGLDPIGDMARTGKSHLNDLDAISDLFCHLRDLGFTGAILRADGRVHHDAGASEAQEVAADLATGVGYLRPAAEVGISLEVARDAIGFLLAADADEFLTIAKFRALRRLWSVMEQSCGLDPRPIYLASETSFRMTTRTDAHVNLLRNTVAVFSSAIGGADAITVLPHTAPLGLADGATRRLARNTQAILIRESNLGRVRDPAGGAGAFEGRLYTLQTTRTEIELRECNL